MQSNGAYFLMCLYPYSYKEIEACYRLVKSWNIVEDILIQAGRTKLGLPILLHQIKTGEKLSIAMIHNVKEI